MTTTMKTVAITTSNAAATAAAAVVAAQVVRTISNKNSAPIVRAERGLFYLVVSNPFRAHTAPVATALAAAAVVRAAAAAKAGGA